MKLYQRLARDAGLYLDPDNPSLRIHFERQQAESGRVQADQEAKRKTEEAEAEHQATLKAEQDRPQAEAASPKAHQEVQVIARAAKVAYETRIHAEKDRREAEVARFRAEEAVKRNADELQAQQAKAEQLARFNAERERQLAEVARGKAEHEAKRKTEQAETEHQARLKAEQERQLAEVARGKAEHEAKHKAEEAEAEHQARLKAEQDLQEAKAARLKMEEEVKQKSAQVEAEQKARLIAEQQRQFAHIKSEEEIRGNAEVATTEQQATSFLNSKRRCPQCKRVFSSHIYYCLYDATPLVSDSAVLIDRRSTLKTPDVLLWLIIAFLATGVLGSLILKYFPSSNSTAGPDEETRQSAIAKPEKPIVAGELFGKATSLPHPEFPADAKSMRASGEVIVAVRVDRNGTVVAARALNGHPLLRDSAVAAAKKAKFTPKKMSGTITYRFP